MRTCKTQRDALLYQNQPPDLNPFFSAVLDEWPTYTIAEKKQIAKAAIERVLVEEDTIQVVFRAPYGD